MSKRFFSFDDKLLFVNKKGIRIVPTKGERPKILQAVHDGLRHFGRDATWKILELEYWWPNCFTDLKNYIVTCEACQLFDPANNNIPPHPIEATRIFETWGLDFVGPLPTTPRGNKYLLVAVEFFTNWPVIAATPDATAGTTARFIYKVLFCTYGPPTAIQSDRGTHFTNKLVEKLCHIVNTKHRFSTPYNPRCNGKVERLNGTIIRSLENYSLGKPTDWDAYLPSVLWAYRTKVNATTGKTPYELLYGVQYRQDNLFQRF